MTGLRSVGRMTDTADITILHPATAEPLFNADGSKMTVTVLSPLSDAFAAIQRDVQDKRLEKVARGEGTKLTAAEIDKEADALLAACIVGWNLTLDTDPLPFDKKLVPEVLEEFKWLKVQIDNGRGRAANFLQKPEKG